jgi:hypothetical protein
VKHGDFQDENKKNGPKQAVILDNGICGGLGIWLVNSRIGISVAGA